MKTHSEGILIRKTTKEEKGKTWTFCPGANRNTTQHLSSASWKSKKCKHIVLEITMHRCTSWSRKGGWASQQHYRSFSIGPILMFRSFLLPPQPCNAAQLPKQIACVWWTGHTWGSQLYNNYLKMSLVKSQDLRIFQLVYWHILKEGSIEHN
jgi:hypothetical protein